MKEYLEADQGEPQEETVLRDQAHEVPVHTKLNMISSGFSEGGNTAAKHKEARDHGDAPNPDLYFMKADLVGVVPHDNDLVVISVVMVGRKVHQALIDQEISADVLFWSTFVNLQLSPD